MRLLLLPGLVALTAGLVLYTLPSQPTDSGTPLPLTLAGTGAQGGGGAWGPSDDPSALYASVRASRSGDAYAWGAGSGRSDADLPQVEDEALTAMTQRLCMTCHNDQLRTGNLSLQGFDVARAHEDVERAEKVITKLRLEMMPPPGIPRPGGDSLMSLAATLEQKIDEVAADNPDPGTRVFQRLNRAEYARAIRDLLGLDVDAGNWLPLDSYLGNFDNMADAQALSPTLLDAYLTAAGTISRIAVGNPNAPTTHSTYTQPALVSQHNWDHVEGAPFGTRGGLVTVHDFPADGEYVFEMETRSGSMATFEDIDVSINGERIALLPFEPGLASGNRGGGYSLRTEPITLPAGQHRVSAAFVRKFEGPYEDLLRPHEWSLAGEGESAGYGITNLPHLWTMTISGPFNPTGISETESRSRIFSCHPDRGDEAVACAESILRRMATEAHRRPVSETAVEGIMSFYHRGAEEGGFENGVRLALQATLASPGFIFRMERQPEGLRAGETFAVDDLDLASRLSFFLWGSPPDRELLEVANQGRLSDEEVLRSQALRMLEDPRAEALSTRFAAQWLRLQDMDNIRPDPYWFPNYSETLASDMRRETELFFEHLLRNDRSFLELFSADYTFANERLARHYGIPNVVGTEFRQVPYPADSNRQGVLGHGSILLLTSMGNRTSPVLRGKWVMEVLMGSPPPPPPPNVPTLEETDGVGEEGLLTTRERMAIHRANPACSSCHIMMDPIGVALDNFDVLGKWRIRENGIPVDTRGDYYDGTRINNQVELAEVLLSRPIPLVRTFTEYLLSYAIARPVEHFDQPTVRALVREAEAEDYRLSSLILGVVMSDPFRMKRADVLADDDVQDR